MKTVTMKEKASNVLVIEVNPAKVARGHEFMAALRRGGRFKVRYSRGNERRKILNQAKD